MATRLKFRVHALQQMMQRQIGVGAVRHIVESGKTVEHDLDDVPYPSRLMLGYHDGRPIHVLIAETGVQDEAIVVTVYEPTDDLWEPGYRKRRTR